MSWTLTEGYKQEPAIAAQALTKNADYQALRSRWQQIVGELRQQLTVLSTLGAQVTLQQDVAKQTATIRDDVAKAYRNGLETITRLNETQRDLVAAETTLALTEISLSRSYQTLRFLLGDNLPEKR